MVMLNKLAKAMDANDARTYKVSSKRSPKLEKKQLVILTKLFHV